MKKAARITVGFILIPIGLVLSVPGVPGPGLAIVFFGLVLLSDHFEWARRAVVWAKAKFYKITGKPNPVPPDAGDHGNKSNAA